MAYEDYFMKIESLQCYIRTGHTGSAYELAKKLNVSRRTLFNYLEILRDKGSEIKFCKIQKTYYFVKQQN
ncbi:MAG: HTH domain-containing protein [Bacteroidales bacterium]|jgi:predicted DNA-binding transcriptional regulator YafY|nr:HTH domain-containing protein [Bacteroidales bacterium]